MKRLFTLGLALTVLAAGCDDSSTNTTPAPTDTATGTDAATGGTDAATGGSDAKADTSKPDTVQKEENYWGDCNLSDQNCIQGCAQFSCGEVIQGCLGDKDCKAYYDCQVGCFDDPIVLPDHPTSVVPLPDEDTETFCGRLCQEKATGPALVKMGQFNNCIVGRCMDCSKSQQGISSAQCKQLCGVSYGCEEDYNACVGDAGCLDALGCVFKCEQSDAACQNACFTGAPTASAAKLNAYNACFGEVDDCVAP